MRNDLIVCSAKAHVDIVLNQDAVGTAAFDDLDGPVE